MTMRPIMPNRRATLILVASACVIATVAEAGPMYRATPLGNHWITNINDRGDLLVPIDDDGRLGTDWLNGDVIGHGFGPRAGQESKLVFGPLRGPHDPIPGRDGNRIFYTPSRKNGMNNHGDVAGQDWSYDHRTGVYDSRAVVFHTDRLPTQVGQLGGGNSYGTAVNDSGQVVGHSTTPAGVHRAFLAQDGEIRNLGTLPGADHSVANAVNAHGVAAGFTSSGTFHGFFVGQTPEDGRAVIFRDGEVIDLGTLGGQSSIAVAINDHGQVAGTSQTADGPNHAFLYTDGEMIDLGRLPEPREWYSPDSGSGASDLNNLGQVVGDSGGRVFLFDGEALFDLEDLLEPDSGILRLNQAFAINDLGQILVNAQDLRNHSTSFVLTPVDGPQPVYFSTPEPSTVAVFATIGIVLAWRRFRPTAAPR
ncbi:hypothetical protein AB1L88_11085 [Tautonia sp. JC769]|uniref:hypothetical protein n=1 Tax=Tautonia sp. JC769 TaxID=3232135 RepID=UPI003458A4AD